MGEPKVVNGLQITPTSFFSPVKTALNDSADQIDSIKSALEDAKGKLNELANAFNQVGTGFNSAGNF